MKEHAVSPLLRRNRNCWIVVVFPWIVSMAMATDSIPTFDTMVVMNRRIAGSQAIPIAKEENTVGMTDDINELIIFKKGVDRVAEAGSLLLVHGGSIYDNIFLISGIPMFAPSHFPGHTFADRSALCITSIKEMQCFTGNAAGVYSDFSGGIVCMEPRVARSDAGSQQSRPEMILNASTPTIELFVSVPSKKKDIYQIGGGIGNPYTVQWFNSSSQSPFSKYASALNFGIPNNFGSISFNGETTVGNSKIREFFFSAIDSYQPSPYDPDDEKLWGIGSVSLENSSGAVPWKCFAGGSRQFYLEGKKYGIITPIKIIRRDNAVIEANAGPWVYKDFALEHECRIERLDWSGALRSFWKGNDSVASFTSADREYSASIGTTGHLDSRGVRYSPKLLAGFFHPGNSFFLDPGLTATLPMHHFIVTGNAGVQTARPDIRGIPDIDYRKTISKAYAASLEAAGENARWSPSVEAYGTYKTKCPAFSSDPAKPIWEAGKETPLVSYGVNASLRASLLKKISIKTVQNVGRSKRIADHRFVSYEWEMPWSNKTVLAFGDSADRLRLFITGLLCGGLPYRDLISIDNHLEFSGEQKRVRVYRNVDIQLQSRQPIQGHRYLTHLEGFAEIHNLLNIFDGIVSTNPDWFWENTREYYWTDNLKKKPATLEYFWVSIGVRIGMKW
jgi:hypothetical protein